MGAVVQSESVRLPMRSRLERFSDSVADSMAASQSASALRFHVFTERFHTFVHLQRDSCTSGSGQLNVTTRQVRRPGLVLTEARAAFICSLS